LICAYMGQKMPIRENQRESTKHENCKKNNQHFHCLSPVFVTRIIQNFPLKT